MLDRYNGPPGSVSIQSAHIDEKFYKQAAAILEVLDPRGHRQSGAKPKGDCGAMYYKLYREETPFSGAHYFDWLDYGRGRYILRHDKNCNKKKFNKKTVHYFNDEARNLHEVYVKPNDDNTQLIWRYKLHDELVPESDKDDPHMYMWALDEKLYIVDDKRWNNKKYGEPKHTGIVAGMPALSGGRIYIGKGGRSILALGITGRTFMQ